MDNEIDQIIDILINFANGNLTVDKPCISQNEKIATIYYGLKMLGPEIQDRIDKIENLTKQVIKERENLLIINTRLAHDLKSPVNNISSLIHFVEAGESSEKIIGYLKSSLNEMNKQIDFMAKITQIHLKPVILKEFPIKQSIAETLMVLQESINNKKIQIVLTIAIENVLMDAYYLDAIFLNLIGNAVSHHSKTDGTGIVSIEVYQTKTNLIIKIKDNGNGIPLEVKEKLFVPFKNVHINGEQGLGLFLVKKSVDNLNGEIILESTQDGTCFTVMLPINKYYENNI